MPVTIVNFSEEKYDYLQSYENLSIGTGSKSFQISHRENSINISLQNENLELTLFDFGVIPNGSVQHKTLQIKNHTLKSQVYEIKRDPAARAEGNFIEVTSTPTIVGPGNEFTFKLCYFPQIPFTFNIDYFNVFDSEGICMKFAAKGISKGPCLTTSGQKLSFICSQGTKLKRKVIEFTNESNILVRYIFDVDVRNSFFKPDPPLGHVTPHGSAYVGITFDPPGPGIYTKDLICLIHYQSPIIIKLEGICTRNDTKLMWRDLNIVPVPQPYRIKHGFDWYFKHELFATESRHILNIRSRNIDFGTTIAGSKDLPKRFTVRNSSKTEVLLKWCKDLNNIFQITPEEQVIPVDRSGVFEARFRPTEPDALYSVELNGYGFWNYVPIDKIDFKNNQCVNMPLDVTVSLMGHTFPAGRNGWIPQIEICPKVVTLPTCVPPLFTYSTFLINRFGSLSVMFKFIPPSNSHFSVRPKQGLIEGDYQIVVVKLSPGEQEGSFEEQWTVRFNGMPQFDENVTFRGFSELPILATETDPVNVIYFPPTHPDCVGYVNVPIRNLTRHCIRYRFCSTEFLTRVTMEGGETMIAPNEVVLQTWSFVPHETGVRELEILLEAVALQDGSFPISTPVESAIMTYQHSQLAHLVAFPRVLDFGPCLLEVKKRAKFRLYNFGICPIHYQLTCAQRGIIIEECVSDVDLLERWETVPPSSSVDVRLDLFPTKRGLQEFVVIYQVREDAFSNELIGDPPKEVIRINYEGIMPKMKVVELKSHALLTKPSPKRWMWQNFLIDRLNTLLATSMPHTSHSVHMTPPEAPLGADSFQISMYLCNNGEVDAEWSLKRKQRCTCQQVQKSRGLSFRDKLYECPHRELFTIESPLSGSLKVGDVHSWTFIVQYTLEGTHELCYKLELSNNRKILIHALIKVLPKDETLLSMAWPNMEFDNIYIGDLHPTLQSFWLYNNSIFNVDYEVDIAQLKAINETPFDFNVIECMNPKAVVKSFNVHPIYFKFDPYQMQVYEITLPIRLGTKLTALRMWGNGIVNYPLNTKRDNIPAGGIIHAPEIPLVFSLDKICIAKAIPTHSKLERIFFFRNQSAQMYSYEWLELRLEDVVGATVSPARGVLHPFQTQICKMSITTGGHPTLVDAAFCVQTVSLTDKRQHENSLVLFREVNRELEGEFIIDRQGTTVPANRTTIFPKPSPLQFTISLKCQVISPVDIDSKVPLRDQLKHAPGNELDLTEKPTASAFTTLDAEKVTDELEKILWDSMSSKWLEETIFALDTDEQVYYSQFFMTRKQEAHMKDKMKSVPSRRMVKIIINNIIYQVLQEYFGFARVADESDIYTARRSSSKKANSNDILKRSELDLSLKVSSKNRVGSDLGLKIKLPDAW